MTPLDEQLPHSVRLTLIQTAVRSVPEVRIVETMEEYLSFTNSYSNHYSITYDKYFTMLQNVCIRYDKSLKQKPSPTARAVYQHELDGDSGTDGDEGDYVAERFAPDGIDTPSDDFYNFNNANFNSSPQVKSLICRTPNGKPKPEVNSNKLRYNGPVYLPKHIYDMLSKEDKRS